MQEIRVKHVQIEELGKVQAEPGSSIFIMSPGVCISGPSPAEDSGIWAEIIDFKADDEFCETITSMLMAMPGCSKDTAQDILSAMTMGN